MTLWLSDVFSPAGLIRALALLLVVAAIAMPNLALVRWTALIAAIVGVGVSGVLSYDAGALLFWGLLLFVSALRLILASNWSFGGRLSPEAELFHQRVVPGLSAGQVRKLLTAGRFREVVPGTALTHSGERIAELCFLLRGSVDIVVDGKKVAECGPGTLIGEIGISTGDPATATAMCATPVRYLGFEAGKLYRLLDSHVELQDAIELAIEKSLRDKIYRANLAAAHASDR